MMMLDNYNSTPCTSSSGVFSPQTGSQDTPATTISGSFEQLHSAVPAAHYLNGCAVLSSELDPPMYDDDSSLPDRIQKLLGVESPMQNPVMDFFMESNDRLDILNTPQSQSAQLLDHPEWNNDWLQDEKPLDIHDSPYVSVMGYDFEEQDPLTSFFNTV